MSLYANQARLLTCIRRALQTSATKRGAAGSTWRSFRLADRIPQELRDVIVASYAAGESAHLLGTRYGVARNSVLALVAESGVPRKIRRMSDSETDEAVRLYELGLSFVSVGKKIGFGPTAVADALMRRGVTARSR